MLGYRRWNSRNSLRSAFHTRASRGRRNQRGFEIRPLQSGRDQSDADRSTDGLRDYGIFVIVCEDQVARGEVSLIREGF
jgi:hypothetical protein